MASKKHFVMTDYTDDMSDTLEQDLNDSYEPVKKSWRGMLRDRWNQFRGKDRRSGTPDSADSYDANFDALSGWEMSENAASDKKLVLDQIGSNGKSLESLGEDDGRIGQNPGAMRSITNHKGSQWQAFLFAAFQSRQDVVEAQLQECDERCEDAHTDRDNKTSYRDSILKRYRFDHRKYNLSSGIVYLILAVVLVIADFPLSFEVTHKGFGISSEHKFWGIIQHNHLLAIGIVLITLYIKIFYDEYFGDPLAKTVARFKRENLHGLEDFDDANDITEVKRNWKIRFSVKLLVLLLLIATIVVLGMFRQEIIQEGGDTEENNTPASLSFILISILIPVISGICASMGVRRMSNWRELRRVKRQAKKSMKIYTHFIKERSLIRSKKKVLENYLKWCNPQGEFQKNCAEYFFACYLHGYHRGARDQMPDDLYDFAHKMRGKIVGTQAGQVFTNMVFNGA
jgi:hypothetical protein